VHLLAEFVNLVDNKASIAAGKFVEQTDIPYRGETGDKIVSVDLRAIVQHTNSFNLLASFRVRYRYVFSLS